MVPGVSNLIHTSAALLTSMSRLPDGVNVILRYNPRPFKYLTLLARDARVWLMVSATNCDYRFGSANLLTENDPEHVKALISMNQSLTAFILVCIESNEYLVMTYVWPITVSTWQAWKPNISYLPLYLLQCAEASMRSHM